MRKLSVYLLSFLPLILGAKCQNQEASEYFNRPEVRECITLIQQGDFAGKMACDGEVLDIPDKLTVIPTQEEIELIRDYYENKEQRLFECLKFGDCD